MISLSAALHMERVPIPRPNVTSLSTRRDRMGSRSEHGWLSILYTRTDVDSLKGPYTYCSSIRGPSPQSETPECDMMSLFRREEESAHRRNLAVVVLLKRPMTMWHRRCIMREAYVTPCSQRISCIGNDSRYAIPPYHLAQRHPPANGLLVYVPA